jgi:hypothetical protein
MTNRDAQMKAWCEYQEALQGAEKKNPGSLGYDIPNRKSRVR